jgi:hypothetical protein
MNYGQGLLTLSFFSMLMGLEFALIVWITPKMKLADGTFPGIYYGMVLVSYAVHQVRPPYRFSAGFSVLFLILEKIQCRWRCMACLCL